MKHDTKLSVDKHIGQKLSNVSVRESIAKLKIKVIDSQAFDDLLFIAKTGNIRRTEVINGKPGKEIILPVSDDQQIDCLKFIVGKVMPNARAIDDSGDSEALNEYWAKVIRDTSDSKPLAAVSESQTSYLRESPSETEKTP